MIRIEWPNVQPTFLSQLQTSLPAGEIVHYSMWRDKGGREKVCCAESLPPHEVVRLVSEDAAKSLVQFNAEWFENDLRASLQIRSNPEAYFANPGAHLLGGIDQLWSWSFSGRDDKALIKERLMMVAQGTDAMRESLSLIFEELFMNAVIDAPREAKNRQISADSRRLSTMTLARRGDRLCLSCSDPYGTLKIEKFVSRMHQVYVEGAGQVINFDTDRGGAGLGCVLLFEHSAILALGVDVHKNTVVSCVVPATMNHRQKDLVKKSLHWIEIDSASSMHKGVVNE